MHLTWRYIRFITLAMSSLTYSIAFTYKYKVIRLLKLYSHF